ncbi:MAG TPA: SIR2 family protein [Pirellulales bacterium]|nr:SIR2 family protein [Pirellulales bacterium]
MNIDPIISLAFAMQTNKGAYALLVGSGLSRAAQIPTGWEIVLDLIGRLATLENEECEPDRIAWYRRKYNDEPDYARLIQELAKSPEERHHLLKAYFEPNADEREQGVKLPTSAHRAIADLVARGYVRAIITTNFDRLLERAIEDAGITPAVLSTADSIEGSLPMVHQRCVVVKVHGDYLDTRIRNTPDELARYDERVDRLLDRILDEFGLLVCGWSADWDTALCAAFDRCKSRRFTLYWTCRGEVGENARRLVQGRSGNVIKIDDADRFFAQLLERVISLEDIKQLHPLSAATAAATVKRLISDSHHRVRLYDLIKDETEAAFSRISDLIKGAITRQGGDDKILSVFDCYPGALATMRELMVHGCYWAQQEHYGVFTKCVPRIARDPQRNVGGYKIAQWVRAAPGVILLYAGGVAALAARNYGMFAHLMQESICRDDGKEGPFVIVYPWDQLHRFAQTIPGVNHRFAADSKWLFDLLREPLRPLLVGDDEYELVFDRFEYLRSLVYVDLAARKRGDDEVRDAYNAPVGLFRWRERYDGRREPTIGTDISDEVEERGDNWEPLKAGLFGGTTSRFKQVQSRYEQSLSKRQFI